MSRTVTIVIIGFAIVGGFLLVRKFRRDRAASLVAGGAADANDPARERETIYVSQPNATGDVSGPESPPVRVYSQTVMADRVIVPTATGEDPILTRVAGMSSVSDVPDVTATSTSPLSAQTSIPSPYTGGRYY